MRHADGKALVKIAFASVLISLFLAFMNGTSPRRAVCGDFHSQSAVPYMQHLDRDHDGIACEQLP